MTSKTVLSDVDLAKLLVDEGVVDGVTTYDLRIARTAMQAVQQSPEIQQALADSKRIDWLADPDNHIGNVQLPSEVVEGNLHSLRDAIDAAMEVKP